LNKGGNAVAVITQRLARSQLKMPKLQVLIYPWLQMYNALLPSEIQYNKKGFFSHTGFSFALYQLWLVGIRHPTAEMELAIQSNNHTLLIDDPNLRRKYQSYLDTDLISVEYKTGKSYYDGYNNKKMQDFVYPTKIDTNNILNKDKKLARSLRQLLTTDASPGLAEDDLLKLLPKAYFIIAEWDTLKDQGLIYAERLRRNGVSTTINFAEHAFHGMVPLVDSYLGYDLARSILNDLVKYIKDNV
jgi:acetyl esterase/lipase